MVWNDKKLTAWGNDGGIRPFSPENVQQASVDLAIDKKVKILIAPGDCTYIDGSWEGPGPRGTTVDSMNPGYIYLVSTKEVVEVPDCAAGLVVLRSSPARMGLFMAPAGWIEPGFVGNITLTMMPLAASIPLDKPLVQLVLFDIERPTQLYAGNYQGSMGATISIWELGEENDKQS